MRQRTVQAFSSLLSRPIIGHLADVATLPEWNVQVSAMVVPVGDGTTLETLPKSVLLPFAAPPWYARRPRLTSRESAD